MEIIICFALFATSFLFFFNIYEVLSHAKTANTSGQQEGLYDEILLAWSKALSGLQSAVIDGAFYHHSIFSIV